MEGLKVVSLVFKTVFYKSFMLRTGVFFGVEAMVVVKLYELGQTKVLMS